MGIGAFPAGLGPAGLDPVVDPTPRPERILPVALVFDGATRDWVMNPDGATFKSQHPVDQQVQLALMTALGTMGSASATGNALKGIRFIQTPRIRKQVENVVLAALSRLLERKVVGILATTIETKPHGRLLLAIDYVNLALSSDARRRFSFDPESGRGQTTAT